MQTRRERSGMSKHTNVAVLTTQKVTDPRAFRQRASERESETTRSTQKHMETFLYLGVSLKTEQTNFIHLRICGVEDKHPALSLNTDSMLHSVFNYSEGGCNYVMFTICEPSLLAQPHTLCAMSTAAANYTDIQAGRSIHKHTTTH